MYSAQNEGKSVIAERFVKTLKAKIYKKVTAICSKPSLSYLNKLVDQNNNTYHCIIILLIEKPINADYSALTEKIEMNSKALKFKVNDRVRITKYKNIFIKGYPENWSEEILIIESLLKTNPQTYKIKDLNGEKIIGGFYKKEFLLSIL